MFWEAVELIHQAWTRPGPFAFEGKHYPLRYVNPWPQPTQQPHPPIWIPSSRSLETLNQIARRGYSYFLSSRSKGGDIAKARMLFADILKKHGDTFQPPRMGVLMSVYVAETDEQAEAEAREGVWYFLKYCLKGHLRGEKGRPMTWGAGIPSMGIDEYRRFLESVKPGGKMLGDAQNWDDLKRSQSIVVGSPETVTRQILDLIGEAHVGTLLIQFHLGNMEGRLARKSARLFAEKVAPVVRAESARIFEKAYPALEMA
jgi:alkanesulfonate monooxygenase SsuD/methylene tetrahydromethanopterin reductase-like flavin-dependent oxidoreductase (luciferase family)